MRWVENSTGSGAESEGRNGSVRPSLIRTKCSFDGNDETFSLVALKMLSRYTYFGLSPADAICDTLVTPRERSCFLEALSVRKMYSNQHHHHLSPSTVSLIKTVDDSFGRDLVRIVEMEGGPSVMTYTCYATDNSTDLSTSNSHSSQRRGIGQRQLSRRFSEDGRSCRTRHGGSSSSSGKGTTMRAFFFPDSATRFAPPTKGKTTTVRNIDWKLAQAIEQVSSLTLDGMNTSPTATEASTSSSSSLAYEPPPVASPQPLQFDNSMHSNHVFQLG